MPAVLGLCGIEHGRKQTGEGQTAVVTRRHPSDLDPIEGVAKTGVVAHVEGARSGPTVARTMASDAAKAESARA